MAADPTHRVAPSSATWESDMSPLAKPAVRPLDPAKFRDPDVTAKGEVRARVAFAGLSTLWFNTGTLCNLTCPNCYIESSPSNDSLVYISAGEVAAFLDEIDASGTARIEIGFTGGEPFMNPDLPAMLAEALRRGHRALVLSNAMRPMMKQATRLRALDPAAKARLAIRVSVDHYTETLHDLERGKGAFAKTMAGIDWLVENGFRIAVAGRTLSGESDVALRAGYARLFARRGIPIDARDPAALVIFPEMNALADVPEITTACWTILNKRPEDMMCATSRMIVKRKGDRAPVVMPCTLLPQDRAFELGTTLADARRSVALNHPHCAKFCVLGGASCSRAS
jgi:organic radical activating enzyme